MSVSGSRLANFVIGGTEKAGTTSVFNYLSEHPQVGASSRKETDFFRVGFSGDLVADSRQYSRFFSRCDQHASVLMEASPGYLGEASTVAPRLSSLIPRAKILFVLRDPVDRLYSSYHFHRAMLNLPRDLSFEDYVSRCFDFDSGSKKAGELGLSEWYLKVLRFGCYAEFLEIFKSQVPVENLKVMFFERLRDNALSFMAELSVFLGIDAEFWKDFEFERGNVTFSSRNKALHQLTMKMNRLAEPVMRRCPEVKRTIVRWYKALNQEREGYDPIPPRAKTRLVGFYGPSVSALQCEPGIVLPESWRYLVDGDGRR